MPSCAAPAWHGFEAGFGTCRSRRSKCSELKCSELTWRGSLCSGLTQWLALELALLATSTVLASLVSAMLYIRVIARLIKFRPYTCLCKCVPLAITPGLTPLQITIKLLVWAGSTIETFGLFKKLKRQFNFKLEEMQTKVPSPITGKVGHVLLSNVLGFLFLGIFPPIHSSVGCCNLSHQPLENSSQHNHLKNSSENVSLLQLYWNMVNSPLSFKFYWICRAHKLHWV